MVGGITGDNCGEWFPKMVYFPPNILLTVIYNKESKRKKVDYRNANFVLSDNFRKTQV